MVDKAFIQNRIIQLLMANHISEHKASLDLGRSSAYIRQICNGTSLPSMESFLDICEYLNITPRDFFDEELPVSEVKNNLYQAINKISDKEAEMVLSYIAFIEQTRQRGGK